MTDRPPTREPLQLIVFDFDGTLCDSADVKTDAFYALYLDDHGPAVAQAVKDHHLANVGVSRYDKIRHAENEMLGNDPSEEEAAAIAERYSRLVEDAVVAAPLFDGVSEFLSGVPGSVRCAVASATPTEELRRIVDRKGLSEHFAAIEGSPRSKTEILRDCLTRLEVRADAVAMVGDQPSDADAARTVGVEALMIAPEAAWVEPFISVDTFRDAAAMLERWIRHDS